MGAFLLVKQPVGDSDIERSLRVFRQMGMPEPREFQLGAWQCWSYDKIRSAESHQLQRGDAVLICSGTPIYRGTRTLEESLQHIFNDLLQDTFDYKNVRGNYALVFSSNGNEIQILVDHSGTWNIYHDEACQVISTSFMAVMAAKKEKLSLNAFAAAEILSSGRLMGPDTLFQGISRYEISLADRIGTVPVIRSEDLISFPTPSKQSFAAEVNSQVNALDDYFKDIRLFGENYGVDSGLTGGHDSRMMLIEIKKHFTNFQVHSFWRKTKDLELGIAEKVAEKAGIPLKIVPGKHHLDKSNEEMVATLEKSLLFYDGHIRMHCFLMEDYHSIEHRSAILGDKQLGINGIGGEQYRNEWHMESNSWSLEYFTRYALAYNQAGRCFTDAAFEQDYFNYLQQKLLRKLGLPPATRALKKKYIQKYFNELYVASLMGIRTNAENKLAHFITPFIDRQLTRRSYQALPHHGISFAFQQAMIRQMDPELASVPSGYGYDFVSGEPVKKKLKYLLKELTPAKMYQDKLDRKFESRGNKDFISLVEKYPVFASAVEVLRSLHLPVDEKTITSRPDMMPVYLSMAYFLKYLSDQGRLDTRPMTT